MIYINKNHNLFLVISHNSTNGKKVLGPLLASVIINNPLQKNWGMFNSNLQVAHLSSEIVSVFSYQSFKLTKVSVFSYQQNKIKTWEAIREMVDAKSVRLRKISLGNLMRCRQVEALRRYTDQDLLTVSFPQQRLMALLTCHWQPEET